MQEKTTFQDLILFAFNETELPQTVRVAQDIENNVNTKMAYEEITDVFSSVNGMVVCPSEKTIAAILQKA